MSVLTLNIKKINVRNLKYLFYIPIGVIAFFIPNAIILKTINPFISVYLSILINKKNYYKFYVSSFFIFLGIIINNSNQMLVKNISTFFIIQIINIYVISKKNKKLTLNIFSRAVIASICLLISNLLLIYFYNLNSFYIVNSLFEASAGFLLTLFLYKGIVIFDFHKLSTLKKTNENDIFSLILFLSVILFSVQNFYINNLNVQFVFFVFLSLVISYNYNSSQSVLVSFIFVFITGVLTNSMMSTYGYMLLLSSFLSGFSKNKLLNIVGYFSGIFLMYIYYFFYNVKVFDFEIILFSFFISSTLFYLIPENVLNFNNNSLVSYYDKKGEESFTKTKFLNMKLNEQLQILNKLSDVFETQYLSIKNKKVNDEPCCNNLNLRLVEANYLLHKQYSYLKKDLQNLLNTTTIKYESKNLMQMKLRDSLRDSNVLVKGVSVFLNEVGKFEVKLQKHSFSMLIETNKILNIINEVLPKKMIFLNEVDGALYFIEKYKFNVIHSVATIKKGENKLSGDTFSVVQNKNADITFTLCDGMGSGDIANKHSTLTIELFEDLIKLGYDKKMAIDLVNSMLLIREDGEFFSSLDCATINKYSGVLKTYKVGASSTYILRNNSIETISSSTLPIGILNNVSVDECNMQLQAGDIIIMVTDGVIDSNYSVVDKENYLARKLSMCNKRTPQGIADYLVEETKKQYGGEALDDCTILVSKIWQSSSI